MKSFFAANNGSQFTTKKNLDNRASCSTEVKKEKPETQNSHQQRSSYSPEPTETDSPKERSSSSSTGDQKVFPYNQ